MRELHYTGKSAEKIKGDLSGEKKKCVLSAAGRVSAFAVYRVVASCRVRYKGRTS